MKADQIGAQKSIENLALPGANAKSLRIGPRNMPEDRHTGVGPFLFIRFLVMPVLGFMLLSDYADYVLLTHPPVPQYALPLLFPLTIAMSIFFTLAGYRVLRNAKRSLISLVEPARR